MIATFFTYVRLAYPYFKRQLTDAMTRHKDDLRYPHVYSALLDLHQLLEFFIPVVKVVVCCLERDDVENEVLMLMIC